METQAVAGIQQMRGMINNGKNRCVTIQHSKTHNPKNEQKCILFI